MEKHLILICLLLCIYFAAFAIRTVSLVKQDLDLVQRGKLIYTIRDIRKAKEKLIKATITLVIALLAFAVSAYFALAGCLNGINIILYLSFIAASALLLGGNLVEAWVLYTRLFRKI